jgi:peptidoglycan/xylan/chitin deacetylase (PgdA/CDA1 family)
VSVPTGARALTQESGYLTRIRSLKHIPQLSKRFLAALSAGSRSLPAPGYSCPEPMQIISLTFDDGLRRQMERSLPILDQHGLPATFFITANRNPMHLDNCDRPQWAKIEWDAADIRQLRDMVRGGHEIGSHSVSHKRPESSSLGAADHQAYDARYEAEESKRLISEWLEMEIPSFCYPFCLKGGGLKEAVKAAGYKQARAGASRAYYRIGDSLDYFDIGCRFAGEVERRENVTNWKCYGDHWHVLTFHGIGRVHTPLDPTKDPDGWLSITPEEFAREMSELAAYRDAGEVEVLTFADAAERMRTANRVGS